MATTGFWPIKGKLKDAIDYAQNPDKTTDRKFLDNDLYSALMYVGNVQKTDKKMFVSAINCPPQRAYEAMMDTKRRFGKLGGNVAYHGYQSFKASEVTPAEAHAIGMETARRMWGSDYQIVVTTHLNTDNIHNHMVINSVSFRTGRKFENHISDHYRLREISDTVCRERGKSVLENANFYGGDKGAYWIRQNGQLTHRDMLRRDMDEAISKSTTYASLARYLRNMGYEFARSADSNSPSLIAKGWKRPVRLKTLGPEYTREAIKERLLRNQYGMVLCYPDPRKTPLQALETEFRQAQKMDGLHLTFALCIELFRLCTGTSVEEKRTRPLSPLLREEARKMDQYSEDAKLIALHGFKTLDQLFAYKSDVAQELSQWERERYLIRNRIRRAKDPEKEELKELAKNITKLITPLRKELTTIDHIAERTKRAELLLQTEREMELQAAIQQRERSYTR